jgi:ribonuclease BN (tRNA processing enzyme)
MIIGIIGSRGTVPTSEIATVSFLIDNRYLFECPSEIIQAFQRYRDQWIKNLNFKENSEIEALGRPTLGKISHIILSHLHYDHWGGILHILHRIMLFEKEKREKEPLKLIIPKNSTIPFQVRMKHLFSLDENNFPLSDEEFLYRFLAIEVGTAVTRVLRIIVIEQEQEIILDNGYSLQCHPNEHLPHGSVAYKLLFKKVKLDVKTAQELGIPFDSTLKKIEKNDKSIFIKGKEITRSDIFRDIVVSVGYSGDTAINKNVLEFLSDCGILIHETTYLTAEENYHLEIHSDLDSLLKEIRNFEKLMLLIPIHFSIRYSTKDIKQALTISTDTPFKIINPLETLALQVDHNSIKKQF